MSKAESAANTTPSRARRSRLQVNLMNKNVKAADKMKDWIILDNGSTLSPFVNPELMEKVGESEKTPKQWVWWRISLSDVDQCC